MTRARGTALVGMEWIGGTAAFVLLASSPAAAQTATFANIDAPADVTVIAARGAPRSVAESAVPVDVIGGDTIRQASPAGDLGQALEQLVSSVNFPRQSNSGVGDAVRAAQLRGLSPDQLLVLVNGKRYHTTSTLALDSKIGRGTAPVDLATLPTGAIARVDVLRDGAGAQYGSDAIAGVIDLGLDRRASGAIADLSYGSNLTAPGAIGRRLRDGATVQAALELGTGLGDGFLTVGGDWSHQQGTDRAGYDRGGYYLSNGSATDPRNTRLLGRRLFKLGDPAASGFHLWYNAETSVAPGLTLYGFGIAQVRRALGSNFFRWPVIVDGDGDDYLPVAQPGGTAGFRPVSVIHDRDGSGTLGLRGAVGGWRVDGSVTYGANAIDDDLRESVNYSLGAASPTRFHLTSLRSDQLVGDLDLTRDYEVGLAVPLTVSGGIELRQERWRAGPGDPASYAVGPLADPAMLGLQPGAQAGPGLTPEDARRVARSVAAGYVETSTETLPGITVDLAARAERYSDAGAALAGKAAWRAALGHGVALRGSVSNSFRAPALAQRGLSSTTLGFGAGGQLRRIATLAVDSPAARALGAAPLRAERSLNLSGGIVAAPAAGLRLTLDLFQIQVRRRLTLSERFDLTALDEAARAALGLERYDAINFFTNAVDLRTRGIEATGEQRLALGAARLTLSAGYSYAASAIRRVAAPPPQLAAHGISGALVGLEEANTLDGAAPRDKLILGAELGREPWSAMLRATRFGAVTHQFDFGAGDTPSQRFAARWSLDAEWSFSLSPRLRLAVGGINLADAYPAPSGDAINGAGNLAYDPLSPIGVNGRYLYARGRIAF